MQILWLLHPNTRQLVVSIQVHNLVMPSKVALKSSIGTVKTKHNQSSRYVYWYHKSMNFPCDGGGGWVLVFPQTITFFDCMHVSQCCCASPPDNRYQWSFNVLLCTRGFTCHLLFSSISRWHQHKAKFTVWAVLQTYSWNYGLLRFW